jgi:hypothetical protein
MLRLCAFAEENFSVNTVCEPCSLTATWPITNKNRRSTLIFLVRTRELVNRRLQTTHINP